ncbi:MAG: HPr family phosphocarrier protein [Clostridiales bacterium]|jgi:catabolite repression HPr-like protein|nr:HPr family phosphocarrier protein [Clostridiales bacterium]
MIKKTVTVNSNMEARPAALFVQAASKFQSSVFVKIDNNQINAKSIMGMMSIGILAGQQVTLAADGGDEEAAIAELSKFFTV